MDLRGKGEDFLQSDQFTPEKVMAFNTSLMLLGLWSNRAESTVANDPVKEPAPTRARNQVEEICSSEA